ncbi:hypothetical protein K443DRAFT_330307 [Laccaria amethystina LaAM-08-1]|uniref:Uncharacterized protein n=1 Tax=Laccaria amethystina LaAM-08-1 TaxID=1095629 RepID=A0A0C9XGW6_9AGAR|nr:hypothetical protein K443DRAFT_330307 [Laccaria amethystina LaAM-08-1]
MKTLTLCNEEVIGPTFTDGLELKSARHDQLGDQIGGGPILEGSKSARRSWGQEDGRQP